MPNNPFGSDPLAPGGASARGGAAGTDDYVDYDVVEIVDEPPAASAPTAPAASVGAKSGFGSFGSKNLEKREASILKREQDVKRREAALAARGAAGIDPMIVKNFPSCCPMVHHDIANDIPDYNKGIMRAGFMLFLLTALTLTWNFVAVVIAMIIVRFTDGAASIWFFAAIYLVIGIPGAWFTWYGRLYRAMMKDAALSWAAFFFFMLVHTAFAIFSAIAPPLSEDGISTNGGLAFAHTGWMAVIELFKKSNGDGGYRFVGICYGVGAGLWTLVSVCSFIMMGRVYNKMRGGTASERATKEAQAYEMSKNGQANGP